MTISSLERVMWRARNLLKDTHKITRAQLKRCIMVECGTSPQTYYNNRDALLALGWIKTNKRQFILTDKDLKGDY